MGWIDDQIKKWILGSMLRRFLAVLSGWLLSLGIAPSAVQQFITGTEAVIAAIILLILSQGWSVLARQKQLEN